MIPARESLRRVLKAGGSTFLLLVRAALSCPKDYANARGLGCDTLLQTVGIGGLPTTEKFAAELCDEFCHTFGLLGHSEMCHLGVGACDGAISMVLVADARYHAGEMQLGLMARMAEVGWERPGTSTVRIPRLPQALRFRVCCDECS